MDFYSCVMQLAGLCKQNARLVLHVKQPPQRLPLVVRPFTTRSMLRFDRQPPSFQPSAGIRIPDWSPYCKRSMTQLMMAVDMVDAKKFLPKGGVYLFSSSQRLWFMVTAKPWELQVVVTKPGQKCEVVLSDGTALPIVIPKDAVPGSLLTIHAENIVRQKSAAGPHRSPVADVRAPPAGGRAPPVSLERCRADVAAAQVGWLPSCVHRCALYRPSLAHMQPPPGLVV